MERHVQIALNNAKAALAFIDPWARVVQIMDTKRYQMVLDDLNAKYNLHAEDAIELDPEEIICDVELKYNVPVECENDDYPTHRCDMPEFSLWSPRTYNEEYYQYRCGLIIDKKAVEACRFGGRGTPFTVEYISDAVVKQNREERFKRLIELGAPAIICFHEELMIRSWEYMLPVRGM